MTTLLNILAASWFINQAHQALKRHYKIIFFNQHWTEASAERMARIQKSVNELLAGETPYINTQVVYRLFLIVATLWEWVSVIYVIHLFLNQ